MASSVEQALEELYAGSPATFTRTRDRLAKELRASGDTEGASAIAARHRPTQIAHVLNQLARRHANALAELVDVGRELARVQRGVLRGGHASGLREAIERQRKVIADLTQRAAGVMRDLGIDPHDHLDEIASALHAALVDPAIGDALESGRLEKAPTATAGFPGAATIEEAPIGAAHERPKRHERDDAKRRTAEARDEATRRKAEAAEARRSKAGEREEAKRRKAEARAAAKSAQRHEAAQRDEAKRRAEESADAERARRSAEAIAAAEKSAADAEARAEEAVAAAHARAKDAAEAREAAKRLAKEAGALAAEAKQRTAAAKRARSRATTLRKKKKSS
ncbi:MAG TPA: hypothetical protein VIF62_22190 [Labilithrix sp.]|jgi:hypothetical protein